MDKTFFVTDSLRVEFRDAGHILGSSFVDIKNTFNNRNPKNFNLVGDLGSSLSANSERSDPGI